MTIWFRKTTALSSEVMRQIAANAGVSWDPQAIIYTGNAIGYDNGGKADITAIQDAAQELLGRQLMQIDAPPEPQRPRLTNE
jgi:nucleoside phosphorylase